MITPLFTGDKGAAPLNLVCLNKEMILLCMWPAVISHFPFQLNLTQSKHLSVSETQLTMESKYKYKYKEAECM